MKKTRSWRSRSKTRQRTLPFHSRRLQRERWFRAIIVLATCIAAVLIVAASPWGRYGAAFAASGARQSIRYVLGLPEPRSETDDAWKRYRELGIESSRKALDQMFAEADPAYRRLIVYAGLDPGHGLLRWGNYNVTLLLPSTVFEADDRGRSYRFRPLTRSIWLRNLTLKSGVLMFFQVPDGPGLAEAMRGTPAVVVETSRQTTNSWGLRGPEPDPEAPLRGIVLGDSYMQGMFIGDDDTPPECLRRYLERETKTRVSVLNTGVLGYSPEQYYYSLIEFADRFRPHFVVISLFTNDFGDLHEVAIRGKGDWEEGKYWLDRIAELCRARQWPYVFVPAPYEPAMFGKRKSGFYPGMIANILDTNGLSFLDLTDDFVDAHLESVIADADAGRRHQGCSQFNDAIGDGHFSASGSRLWAQVVGRRLVLLMGRDRASRAIHESEQRNKAAPGPASR